VFFNEKLSIIRSIFINTSTYFLFSWRSHQAIAIETILSFYIMMDSNHFLVLCCNREQYRFNPTELLLQH
jgi:hypothetical protein